MEKAFPEDFTYFQINIADKEAQDLELYFEECNEFIKNSDRVLVHCVSGVSRSPAIVLGYLIGERNMSLEEAFELVKKKRAGINPNCNFMRNLKNFEEKKNEKNGKIEKLRNWKN